VCLAIAALVLGATACESTEHSAATPTSKARRSLPGFTVVMPPAELSDAEAAALTPAQRDLPGVAITLPRPWRPVLPPLDTAFPVRFSISNRKQRPLCTTTGGATTCDRRTLRRVPPASILLTFEWLPSEPKCPTGTPKSECSISYEAAVEKLPNQVFVERRTAPGAQCAVPGAARTVTYRGWTVPPDGHEFAVIACIRGPRFHALDDQVERAMRTVSFLGATDQPPTGISPDVRGSGTN
jgi:hypothetical protein